MTLQLPRGLNRYDVALLDEDGAPGSVVGNVYPQQLTARYQSTTFDIQGGDVRLEQGETDQRYELELTTADLPLAIYAVIYGGTVSTTGTGTTAVSTYAFNVGNAAPFFRFRAQQKDNSGGHTVFRFPKTQKSGFPSFTLNQGAYNTPAANLIAFPATDAVAGSAGPPKVDAVVVDDLLQLEQAATFAALS